MKRMFLGIFLSVSAVLAFGDATIIDNWGQVAVPAAPELRAVAVDPTTTALLLLDFQDQTVSSRPRAVATVPRVKNLLDFARAAHLLVAYSTTNAGSREAILPALQALPEEHVVKASVDKFFGTDLEQFLKSEGIKQNQTIFVMRPVGGAD